MKRGGYLKQGKGFKPRKSPVKRKLPKEFGLFTFEIKKPRRRPLKAPRTRVSTKGYKSPPWFNKLRLGAHGSNPAQKRYWGYVSDKIRQEEFEKYKGKCVSCPRVLSSWQEGQCAHYKPWSVCHGYFKYERTNLAFSCPWCNGNGGADVGYAFGEELKRRYGENHLTWIEHENEKHRGEKMQDWEIVARVEADMLSLQ